LKSAAGRGVTVTIIVPEKNDSKLVHYASRARYGELLSAAFPLDEDDFKKRAFHKRFLENSALLVGSLL